MSELPREFQVLRDQAKAASANAWCPHSGFRVGAALRDAKGHIHVGCNVESDSFGLTQCAERNALGAAVVAGVRPGECDILVIYLPGDRPLPPCGACRQVMVEILHANAQVVACCDGDLFRSWRCGDLLPEAFTMAAHGPGDRAKK